MRRGFLDLTDDDLDRLADALAARLGAREAAAPGKWMNSADAAHYLGMTRYALDKLCAARTVPFEQDTPGGKRWFKAADLDAWRRGEHS